MDELKEYLELLIESKVPIFYYGETFELEAEALLNALLRKLGVLNGNSAIVREILETRPAIKKEGLEASLLRFHLEEIDDIYENLIQIFSPATSEKCSIPDVSNSPNDCPKLVANLLIDNGQKCNDSGQ